VRENGSCSNRRIFYLQDVEEAVLRGMAEKLKDTRLIETMSAPTVRSANVAPHPAKLDSYIATVDRLAAVLADHIASEDDRGSLVSSFRALVHSAIVHPMAPREGFHVGVKGKLAALIGGKAFPQAKYSGGRVVAEEGFEPPTQGL
jgi:hypothetical protein